MQGDGKIDTLVAVFHQYDMTNVQPKVIGGSRVRSGVLLLGVLSVGCSGSDLVLPQAVPEVRLALVSGNKQTGTVGEQLPKPLVVELRDQDGRVITGRKVAFVVEDWPGGEFAPDTAVTDGDGQAVGHWVLGTTPGVHGAEARLIALAGEPEDADLPVVGVTASAQVGRPDTVKAVSETTQSGGAGEVVKQPPMVRVVDRFGNPISGVVVQWTVLSGGGTVSAASVTTGADGVASVTWTLGRSIGRQQVQARVDGPIVGSPVVFSAIVFF